MMSLSYHKGGGQIKFQTNKRPSFTHPESKINITEWVDVVIEYQEGKILLQVND